MRELEIRAIAQYFGISYEDAEKIDPYDIYDDDWMEIMKVLEQLMEGHNIR